MNRLKNTCHLARNRYIAHLYYRISNQFWHHRGEKNTANKITHDSNYELKKNKNLLYCGEVWSPFVAFWVLRAISLPSIVSESPTETNPPPLPPPPRPPPHLTFGQLSVKSAWDRDADVDGDFNLWGIPLSGIDTISISIHETIQFLQSRE